MRIRFVFGLDLGAVLRDPHILLSDASAKLTMVPKPRQPLAMMPELRLGLDQQVPGRHRVLGALPDRSASGAVFDLDPRRKVGQRIRELLFSGGRVRYG